MSLNKILNEIKEVKPFAEEQLEDGALETLAGRRGRKRSAEEKMKGLREQYIDELRTTAVFILVSGSARKEFSDLAVDEFKCFTADPEGFYQDLAQRIPPILYVNQSGISSIFEVVGRHLEDKALELKIIGYPQLIFKQQYARHIEGKEDFVKLLKEAINDQVGPEIAGIQVIRSIADEAINKEHEGKITPIVLSTDDEKLAIDLNNSLGRLGSRSFLVAAGKGAKSLRATEGAFVSKEVSKENVESILTNIRSMSK